MEFKFNNFFKKKPAPAPVEPKGDEAVFIPLSESAILRNKILDDLKQKQTQERLDAEQEQEKKRIRESIPTMFDVADFDIVLRRLEKLQNIENDPNYVVFHPQGGNRYTVDFLIDLFTRVQTEELQELQSNNNIIKPHSEQELIVLDKIFAQQGVTSKKIDESSKFGLRGCLMQCVQNFRSRARKVILDTEFYEKHN